MPLVLTYQEFLSGVHDALRTHKISSTTFTPAVIELLEKIKPQLAVRALEFTDPREPPYNLTEFIKYIEENWNEYDRPRSEFR